MRNNERVMKLQGDPSSKYGLHPERFEEDMQRHKEEADKLYEDFKEFMRNHKADVKTYRFLFMRYYEEFIQ